MIKEAINPIEFFQRPLRILSKMGILGETLKQKILDYLQTQIIQIDIASFTKKRGHFSYVRWWRSHVK